MENKFILTKDLARLTEEQREQHLINVCEAAGLDPKAGLLKYTMMSRNDGSNEQTLVLYATKGATNQIRSIRGIDVIEMVDKMIGNTITYTAKAKDKNGRIDIAVGASDLTGKRGKQLENAFAIAQTRASRRVTLQLSGLDLLDESEVIDDKTVSIVDAPVPLAEIGQPVEVSSAPGKDITESGLTLKIPHSIVPFNDFADMVDLSDVKVQRTEEPKRIPNPAAGLKPIASIQSPDGAEPKDSQPTEEVKIRRKRRTKAEMEEARSSESPKVEESVAAVAAEQAVQEPVSPTPIPPSEPIIEVVPVKVEKVMIGNMPTADQMKGYVARLTVYRTDILPNGGMVPSHGMGITKKIREFFRVANAGVDDLNKLTVEQWNNTFVYMDGTVEKQGAKELVKVIDFNVGATDEVAAVSA